MKYRPYNQTFASYHDFRFDMDGALAFIRQHNKLKGGVWVLHTETQYIEWKKTHPENKEINPLLLAMISPMARAIYPKFMDTSLVYSPHMPEKHGNE